MDGKFVYVGREPKCGCAVGIITDNGDEDTGQCVTEFIADGLIISRVSWQEYVEKVSEEKTFMACPHAQDQPISAAQSNNSLQPT